MATSGKRAKKNLEHADTPLIGFPLDTVFSRTTRSRERACSESGVATENGGPIRNPRPGSVMEWKVMRQESIQLLTLPLLAHLSNCSAVLIAFEYVPLEPSPFFRSG